MLWGLITVPHVVIFIIGGIVGALIVLNNYRKAKALQAELQAKIDELKTKIK
jgi:uncharacterized membrane-anchored protein YhcB (DUF1043 family)